MIDADPRVQRLRERYRASFPLKRDLIERCWECACAQPDEASVRAELRHHVHRLAGSAPVYGYDQLGRDARRLDTELVDWERSDPHTRGTPAELLAQVAPQMERLLRLLHTAIGEEPAAGSEALRVVVVGDPQVDVGPLAAELRAHGCEVSIVADPDMLWQTLAGWPCSGVLFDARDGDRSLGELTRMLRAEPSFATIAIVGIAVGSASPCDVGLDADADAEQILAALRAARDRRRRTVRQGTDAPGD